eukprot:765791-Hanusia_phi.AAC.8
MTVWPCHVDESESDRDFSPSATSATSSPAVYGQRSEINSDGDGETSRRNRELRLPLENVTDKAQGTRHKRQTREQSQESGWDVRLGAVHLSAFAVRAGQSGGRVLGAVRPSFSDGGARRGPRVMGGNGQAGMAGGGRRRQEEAGGGRRRQEEAGYIITLLQ